VIDSYPHPVSFSPPGLKNPGASLLPVPAAGSWPIMCHSTPATYLVWSLLSCLLGVFLIYHLWCFDRFQCLRWNQGSQGTFKRVMTYSYLLSTPLLITYAVGFCIIKYKEGFVVFAEFGVIPTPYQLWTSAHRQAIIPLYLCLSMAWALEMVTHLEGNV